MIKKSFFAALLLIVAGLQTVQAQHGMQVWQNGKYELFFVDGVDSVRFVKLVTDIYLSQEEISMNVGETSHLTATVFPIDADEHSVTWESSNPDIASVDGNGQVTAASPGNAIITATATDGSGTKAECQVTVIQLVTGITLNETSITLLPGETSTLTATVEPSTASNPAVTWESSNPAIASIDASGVVTAKAIGTCTITCRATDESGVYAECQVTVADSHEYVDLCLPSGTLWATCNVGANSPEEYGDYFAWGETEPKAKYEASNYKWCNTFIFIQTKYCTSSEQGDWDGKTVLEPMDDAATVNWNSDWHMPSLAQISELINSNYTTAEWTTQNGVNGYLITSKYNNKSIFLPAAGYYGGYINPSVNDYIGIDGAYWSRTLNSSDSRYSFLLSFSSDRLRTSYSDRSEGRSVRPVRIEQVQRKTVTEIVLNETSIQLLPNETKSLTATVLPADADIPTVTWQSSNLDVAQVSSEGLVTAKAVGNCTITCSATDGSGVTAVCQVKVRSTDENEYEFVDLGLPSGTLWATCNVGANSPEEYGDYFAWGETIGYKGGKTTFTWDNYKYSNGTYTSLTKYCTKSSYGTVDNKTELEPEDDAATANWGSDWRMPSSAQLQELYDSNYTTTEWTTQNGVNGRLITSKSNGMSIFLPAAGFRGGTGRLDYAGEESYYWSRSLYTDYPQAAYELDVRTSRIGLNSEGRCLGQSVRPVRVEPAHRYVDLGLPSGTLWATCNVGAFSPEEYGNQFAWGETEAKSNYGWDTYKYCMGAENTLTKYCTDSNYGYNGFVDNKTELEPEDDAATANWGSGWQMPSREQIVELFNINYTTSTWTYQNDVPGRKITSIINGNIIFLPAEDYDGGYYWSRTLSSNPTAFYAKFNKHGIISGDAAYRFSRNSVRPVRKQ